MGDPARVPGKAWVVVFAGATVNLCLGILYAWSVWKASLISDKHPAGTPMSGLNEGWTYLSKSDATWAYAICGFTFALFMIPGGRIQDKYGPKLGATLGGLCLAGGCIIAGLLKSYTGLVLGFGLLGGIGMGLGYAAATPAAVKWFGPHRRALIVGIVVGGYGAAAIYISPLAKWLIQNHGLSASFIGMGMLFAVVVIVAGQLLAWPPADYRPSLSAQSTPGKPMSAHDWTSGEMLKTWQFYALVFLFIGAAQSGLLVIANAAPILNKTAASIAFFAANAWILSSFGGVLSNAGGRGRHRLVFRPDRSQPGLPHQRQFVRRLPVIDAGGHGIGQRSVAFFDGGNRHLAIRRRLGALACFHGRFFRLEELGPQLRPGVCGLGCGLLHSPSRGFHRGHHGQSRLRVLHVGRNPRGRGRHQPVLARTAGASVRELNRGGGSKGSSCFCQGINFTIAVRAASRTESFRSFSAIAFRRSRKRGSPDWPRP